MKNDETRTGLLEQLDIRLRETQPGLNRYAVLSAAKSFLQSREEETCPGAEEVSAYLDHLTREEGEVAAQAEFAWLQIAAAHLWGRQKTSFFASVLRQVRVTDKKARKTEWDSALGAVEALPKIWRPQMMAVLEVSRKPRRGRRKGRVWSASHITAVSRALARWHDFCLEQDLNTTPTGFGFQAYADHLNRAGVVPNSIRSYLQRILSGFSAALQPGFHSDACTFVVEEYKRAAETQGAVTKTGQVAASTLYTLGFGLMEEARQAPVLNLTAAIKFRDGLLLALGIALPQRARALSVLEDEVTIGLDEHPCIWVNIPGSALKLPELRKPNEAFVRRFRNPGLWEAVSEYLNVYRPLFDDGTVLFPSRNAQGAAISEKQIGRRTAQITSERLGIRVPIHRFRDSAATEAAEDLENGGALAPALLGHRDEKTTRRYYDHSEGVKGARDFSQLIQTRRSAPVDLKI